MKKDVNNAPLGIHVPVRRRNKKMICPSLDHHHPFSREHSINKQSRGLLSCSLFSRPQESSSIIHHAVLLPLFLFFFSHSLPSQQQMQTHIRAQLFFFSVSPSVTGLPPWWSSSSPPAQGELLLSTLSCSSPSRWLSAGNLSRKFSVTCGEGACKTRSATCWPVRAAHAPSAAH